MNIGVLGTGQVGQTIASKLAELGHEVSIGGRSADNERAQSWVAKTGGSARCGTFADVAAHGEVIFNCTLGEAAIQALELATADNLEGKVLVDVSNPLDFSQGMPPSLLVCNTDSLGERIQRAFPKARVVKALNTISSDVMVNPAKLGDEHATFLSGDDHEAKLVVRGILESFGWKQIVDLGDINTARGTEQYLPLWIRLMSALGTPNFNVKIVRAR
jgi:predicted dinucleotide-binding enzyme